MASTHKDILDQVVTQIKALSLTDMEECVVRAGPNDNGQFYPGITVSPIKENEFLGTNERDDIGYGVQVTMVVNDDNNLDEHDLMGTWRQNIRKEFIHQKLLVVSNVCTVLVEPGPVYADNDRNQDISTLVLRVIVRETRG